MAFETGGDASVYVKADGGSVKIGAGERDKLIVSVGSVSASVDIVTGGDINSRGGTSHEHKFLSYRVNQGTTPMMTSSIVDFSGTAAAGNGTRIVFTQVPMLRAGSVLGIGLLTQNCTVKSGSLSGTVNINGTPSAATIGMHTGTIATRLLDKDSVTFTAGQYLELQLTASSVYYTDLELTSGSFQGFVWVEY